MAVPPELPQVEMGGGDCGSGTSTGSHIVLGAAANKYILFSIELALFTCKHMIK